MCSSEETQEYFDHVIHPVSRGLMADVRKDPSPASDLEGRNDRIARLEMAYDVLEKKTDPLNPITPIYALLDLEELLGVCETHQANIDMFEGVYKTFKGRKESYWTDFIGAVELGVGVKDLEEVPEPTVYKMFQNALDLLIETSSSSGVESRLQNPRGTRSGRRDDTEPCP
jgi:hypothetical protein